MNTATSDSLYVNWHLLHGLNHDCEYSQEPESAQTEKYALEPLLETAFKLLSLHRPQYIFRFFGGEPSIHPYFPQLLTYIATSGRNICFNVDTNGIRKYSFYKGLFKPIPQGQLCVHFHVHCKYMDLIKVLNFVGIIVESGYFCRVTVNHVQEYAEKALLFFEKLRLLQKTLPFALQMAFPLGNGVATPSVTNPTLPAWTQIPTSKAVKGFAVVGANAVHVDMQGNCSISAQILSSPALRSDLPEPPVFTKKEAGEAWLKSFQRRVVSYELEGGLVRVPASQTLTDEQWLQRRLKRLHAGQASREIPFVLELWTQRRSECIRIAKMFADEASRDVFYRRYKAQILGDSSYCLSSAYSCWQHPRFSSIPYTNGTVESGRLRFEKTKRSDIAALLPKIRWYHPSFELAFTHTAEWFDILSDLSDLVSEYTFYLGQHGEQTVCYGLPVTPSFSFNPLPSRRDGHPLVSILICADSHEEALQATVASTLEISLPCYEIVVMQDSRVLTNCMDRICREHPWHVRAFRYDEPMSLTALWNAGLHCIQGEYVCFLRSGDILHASLLAQFVDALETQGKALAFCEDFAPQSVRGKVYRTKELHKRGITFCEVPGDLEDTFFNSIFSKEQMCSCTGVLVDTVEGTDADMYDRVHAFFAQLCRCVLYCAAHDMPLEKIQDSVLARFLDIEDDFLRVLRCALRNADVDSLLSRENIRAISSIPVLLEHLRSRVSDLYAEKAHTSLENTADYSYTFYPPASVARKTAVTCILIVRSAESIRTLETLMRADPARIACLCIDASSDPKLHEVLEVCADMYPQLRICTMSAAFQDCLKVAVKETVSPYITFVDVETDPGFLQYVDRFANDKKLNEAPDTLLYGFEDVWNLQEKGLARLQLLMEQGWALSLNGFLLRTEYLKNIVETKSVFSQEALAEEIVVGDTDTSSIREHIAALLGTMRDSTKILPLVQQKLETLFVTQMQKDYVREMCLALALMDTSLEQDNGIS